MAQLNAQTILMYFAVFLFVRNSAPPEEFALMGVACAKMGDRELIVR